MVSWVTLEVSVNTQRTPVNANNTKTIKQWQIGIWLGKKTADIRAEVGFQL